MAAQQYENRWDGGRALAEHIAANAPDLKRRALILGLPRGGVPVAREVAEALACPFDTLLVKKLGVPGHEELAFGALSEYGALAINESVTESGGLDAGTIEGIRLDAQRELEQRAKRYRGGREPPAIEGRACVLVDDGLATGATMRAAVQAARAAGAKSVDVAVPVAPPEAAKDLEGVADRFLCPMTPAGFMAVGAWYRDFSQTTDDEVRALLAESGASRSKE